MLGRVEGFPQGLPWRVVFPDVEHLPASSYLRELHVSDCSALTLRSYAFALLRWFRFLDGQLVRWERAERVDVRLFIEQLRQAPAPRPAAGQARAAWRGSSGGPPGSVVVASDGPEQVGRGYAPRTINHQLSVLFGFYEHACAADLGPLVNPVPAQRSRVGSRPHAHHDPARPFVRHRRGNYRQKTPRPVWRGLPEEAAEALFGAMRCNRDRALLSFYLSSGVRASELLGLGHGDWDSSKYTITVVSKGTRARDTVPASVDSFFWLGLYLSEGPPVSDGGPVWWTRRGAPVPLTYHAMRAVLQRANASLGSRWRLHDLRHTAAARLLADPAFTLVDVQAILRHASVTTTQIYAQPRLEELVEKVLEHYGRSSRPPVSVAPGYDSAAVRELLGLP